MVCSSFDNFLTAIDRFGFRVADSRDHLKSVNVAHSIFTQKFRASCAVYARTLELPAFGHGENHALLQVCDIISSALIDPIATLVCCTGQVANVHVPPGAAHLRQRFAAVPKDLPQRCGMSRVE
ncbi:hypothetical protein D8B34_20285 [Verminephrobacter eiseniae]|nr:hypothetical protein [Verminephrobacter eiseniae]MCW5291825.1 hypothetical protein [Verminephrobacter eiseniae]MCW8186534.1 hypothetical protein [Verminephrobacter eiseniae]MCW8224927.1 hypothetical protein [Verminephrobacter eiseniae]MCW8235997.1 hypothetical protein [Verminephrobacter eiseniae]